MTKKKAKKTIYLAYGSNMHQQQMEQRCPWARKLGTMDLPGYRLEFRRVATLVPDANSVAPIMLWEITPQDELALDRYEGFPRLYRKEYIEITFEGKPVEAMMYLMNCGNISEPDLYYYSIIYFAYVECGFDIEPLNEAVRVAAAAGKVRLEAQAPMDDAIRQLLDIRATGETNMFDLKTVRMMAEERGFDELCALIEEFPDTYWEIIRQGRKGAAHGISR